MSSDVTSAAIAEMKSLVRRHGDIGEAQALGHIVKRLRAAERQVRIARKGIKRLDVKISLALSGCLE